MNVINGTSRTVVLTRRWAFKLPFGLARKPVRGWLANRSEWRQRQRPDVSRPRVTVGHLVIVMARAECTGDVPFIGLPAVPVVGDGDEAKPDSWGWFAYRWLLVDFDRSWEEDDRGLVGRCYWGNQERLGRKWARLG